MSEDPTLKIRVALPGDGSHWGRDCHQVARRMIGDQGTVLDAKWGREPTKWRETGGGWGRAKLDQYDRGFVDACREVSESSVVARLVRIIDGMTKP